jgi:crossover junction endodeoxyribonuclease RuvC
LGLAEPDARGRVAAVRTTLRSAAPPTVSTAAQVRILGLDPGSLRTGYAIVEINAASILHVTSGTIRARGETLTERLQEIFASVEEITREFRPEEVAIEGVFMHRNADSALKLGQARGAALSATFAARPRVFEYAPRAVKLAVVGTGAAQKEQVQLMVKKLLRISGPLGADTADALAIALCHAHSRKLHGMMAMAGGN